MENSSDERIKCVYCNADIPEGNKFCTECGKPIEEVTNVNSTEMNSICPKCYNDVEPGLKYCTKCGVRIEHRSTMDQVVTCPQCFSNVDPGLRFCTNCGTKIKNSEMSVHVKICPKCFVELKPGMRFCTECGEKIGHTSANQTTCPNCYAETQPGLRFCTECGTSLEIKKESNNITEGLKKLRKTDGKSILPKDETVDSMVSSGKGLMKGLGGFIDKTATELDKNINQASKKGPGTQSYEISQKLKERRQKK